MLVRLPNLTDISISRLSDQSLNRGPQRALSISNLHSRSSFSTAKPNPIQIRENQLLWMFNRRKQKLIETSVENFRLYNRIKTQKSQLSKFNKGRVDSSRYLTEADDKENIAMNCIREKEHKIEMMLNRTSNKDWKRIIRHRGRSQII